MVCEDGILPDLQFNTGLLGLYLFDGGLSQDFTVRRVVDCLAQDPGQGSRRYDIAQSRQLFVFGMQAGRPESAALGDVNMRHRRAFGRERVPCPDRIKDAPGAFG